MKKVIAVAGIVAGALLIVVPRYVLPACEYEGYARMHCSDTATAVRVLGAVLVAVGSFVFAVKKWWGHAAGGVAACVLLIAAYYAPDVYGYCTSSKMPCHYGMVPAIRFIAAIAFLVLAAATALLVRDAWRWRGKGHS